MKSRSRAYTVYELNKRAEQFRATQEKRVHEFRLKKHTDKEKKITKTDCWDMPLTVCSCGSLVPPFIATNGRNCSALKEPHPVLSAAYGNIKDNYGKVIGSIPLGQKPSKVLKGMLGLKGKESWEAGRCAEPHAASRLMKNSGNITNVSEILFSMAYESRYPISKSYCATCKCVFPKLR